MFKEILQKIIYNKYLISLVLVLIGFGSAFILGADNPVEEYAEDVIKVETGIDIDLSPESAKMK